jgi:glycosyltransferase involved in cell wall biosynthesis
MKILQINTVCGTGSTGRIAVDLYHAVIQAGHDCFIAYGRGSAPSGVKSYRIGSDFDMHHHALMTRITDKTGLYSSAATKKFLKTIDGYAPDIIHLHNLHGYYINLEMLFSHLSKINKPIVWTLHDCWAFTGHCAFFDYADCGKWRTGCHDCPQKASYPKSILLDNSEWNYTNKRRLFTSVENMTSVTPSAWLADLVRESFLGKYKVQVIQNGIDLDIFKPTDGYFREKHGLEDKFIVLGVANIWDRRKGLDDFDKLSALLEDSFRIVLLGLDEAQLRDLPKNILGFERTSSVSELAEIYTAADVYVNTSVEESMGLTTVEALACGTPVVVYNATAVPESVDDSVGIVVEKGDASALHNAILEVKNKAPFSKEACIKRAMLYNKVEKYEEYLEVYQIRNSEFGIRN